jgi:plasmid maintenance system killer protein
VKALRLTLTGNAIQPVETRYPNLSQWIRRGRQLVVQALQTADSHQMDEIARQQFTITIDRRPMSMDVILRAVQHNMDMEYPMLMEARIEHNLTTLYAINVNDQYRVSRLLEADGLPDEIRIAVEALWHHLQNIPSSHTP